MANYAKASQRALKRSKNARGANTVISPQTPRALQPAYCEQDQACSNQTGGSSARHLPNNIVCDERDGGAERSLPIMSSSDSGALLKFACPFYKRWPHAPLSKSCAGPGWDTIHRVKEHLCRNHTSRNTCTRCGTHFAKEADLQTHKTYANCEKSLHTVQTITEEQAIALRSKKRTRDISEAGKWRQIYRILFPGGDADEIPTPYHDMSQDQYGHLNKFAWFLIHKLPNQLGYTMTKGVEPASRTLSNTSSIDQSISLAVQELYDFYKRETIKRGRRDSKVSVTPIMTPQMHVQQDVYPDPTEQPEPVGWNLSHNPSEQQFAISTPSLCPAQSFGGSDGSSLPFTESSDPLGQYEQIWSNYGSSSGSFEHLESILGVGFGNAWI